MGWTNFIKTAGKGATRLLEGTGKGVGTAAKGIGKESSAQVLLYLPSIPIMD